MAESKKPRTRKAAESTVKAPTEIPTRQGEATSLFTEEEVGQSVVVGRDGKVAGLAKGKYLVIPLDQGTSVTTLTSAKKAGTITKGILVSVVSDLPKEK